PQTPQGTIHILDIRDRKKGHAFAVDTSQTRGLAFSSDGRRLATGLEGARQVWDTRTGRAIGPREDNADARCVCFTLSGTRRCTIREGVAKIRADDTDEKLLDLEGSSHKAVRVCFSSDGKRLVTGHDDGAVRVWDVQTGRELL